MVVALKPLPFHVPLIEEDEIAAVVAALRSGWLTAGPGVKAFEDAFASYIGARHAIAVSSCTAALHLSLEAAGIREGDEVLVPTIAFAACAEVVTYLRAVPVLVDIEPDQRNISLEDAACKITPRTRAIMAVHFAGHPCPMTGMLDFARSHGLALIEDAAHALPAKYENQMVGTFGPLTSFSFYSTKTITTGEGGMITTDDRELASRIRLMRLHGLSRDPWKQSDFQGSWRYQIVDAGFKYNFTDPQAALGLVQLAKCDLMRQKRQTLASRYDRGLEQIPAFRAPKVMHNVQHAWHLYVVSVDSRHLRIHRDRVIHELQERGIGTSVHFIPLHTHPYYRERWGYRNARFPAAEEYFDCCLSLPLYPGMSDSDADRVIDALDEIGKEFRR